MTTPVGLSQISYVKNPGDISENEPGFINSAFTEAERTGNGGGNEL